MKSLVRLTIAVAILICCTVSANAQSTVHLFVLPAQNADCVMSINGGEVFNIRGPLKKNFYGTLIYHPAKKKLVLKDEGKALLAAIYTFYANMDKSNPRNMASEIQLNLSEGSVHYVQLSWKGINDVQLKEIDEKKGLKLLKDKKYRELPDYIEQ